jgi:archaellum component FlaF (FlaF/FlaG flagellin family)
MSLTHVIPFRFNVEAPEHGSKQAKWEMLTQILCAGTSISEPNRIILTIPNSSQEWLVPGGTLLL